MKKHILILLIIINIIIMIIMLISEKCTTYNITDLVDKYSKQHKVDDRIVKAIIKWESWGNKNMISHKGAIGLMMIMPETARNYWRNRYDNEKKEWMQVYIHMPNKAYESYLSVPSVNICIGTWELKQCLRKANGNYIQALNYYIAGKNTEYTDFDYLNKIINELCNFKYGR